MAKDSVAYRAGYRAAMKRRLGPNRKPFGKPQHEPAIYRCAKCGSDSTATDRCPNCQSPEIMGQVDRYGNMLLRAAQEGARPMTKTEENVQHTPGPWLLGRAGHSNVVRYDGDDILPVASVPYEPNARLIAAAPDLLAALKKAAHVFHRCELDPVDNNYTSILEQAEMAIAKATGSSR